MELISPLILVLQMPRGRVLLIAEQTKFSPYLTKTVTKLTLGVIDNNSTGEFIKIVYAYKLFYVTFAVMGRYTAQSGTTSLFCVTFEKREGLFYTAVEPEITQVIVLQIKR